MLLLLLLCTCLQLIEANNIRHRSGHLYHYRRHDLPDPEFVGHLGNITVPAGRLVKLTCAVKNLGPHKVIWLKVLPCPPPTIFCRIQEQALRRHSVIWEKVFACQPQLTFCNIQEQIVRSQAVAWLHFEHSAILAVHGDVITRNPRITVSNENLNTFNLHISEVKPEDGGRYMCQITGTPTAKTQLGYLQVVVPPDIDDLMTSSDVIDREGSNVTLFCNAKGSPKPTIKWRRNDNQPITINKTHTVQEVDGPVLHMAKISRLDMGIYLCIASNGVPPPMAKKIRLSVVFPPMLWIPHQLVGSPYGRNVTLECFTEAYPNALNYWTREDGQMIHESKKYHILARTVDVPYKIQMMLVIIKLQNEDFGTYKCVAKNPNGETDGTIRLYYTPIVVDDDNTTSIIEKSDKDVDGYYSANDVEKGGRPIGGRQGKGNRRRKDDTALAIPTSGAESCVYQLRGYFCVSQMSWKGIGTAIFWVFFILYLAELNP